MGEIQPRAARAARGVPFDLGQRLQGLLSGARHSFGKKTSTRTPLEPKKAPAHHLHRWRDEGRATLIMFGLRLGVLDQSRPPVGHRGQFKTWKALAVAVERARRELDS